MIDPNKLCMGCMRERESVDGACPYCGFELQKYEEERSTRILSPGTILEGKYLLGKVIGEGGFGITYLALDLNLEIKVAIKEYFPAGLATRDTLDGKTESISVITGENRKYYEYGLRSFSEEAKNLAKFRGISGVTSVRDFFLDNMTAYLVMEFIRGKTLKKYLDERKTAVSEKETLQLMRPVMTALSKIHKEGIIHRDISPENIMLTEDGQVVLIDFGAARISAGIETKSLTVLLKHGYAPVEQYQTKGKQGPWTDIYAICATMYRMLSGTKPEEAVDRMVEDRMQPLHVLAESRPDMQISENVSNAIQKGLSVNADERWQNVELLMDALYGESQDAQSIAQSVSGQTTDVLLTMPDETNAEEKQIRYKKNVDEVIRRNTRNGLLVFFLILAFLVSIGIIAADIDSYEKTRPVYTSEEVTDSAVSDIDKKDVETSLSVEETETQVPETYAEIRMMEVLDFDDIAVELGGILDEDPFFGISREVKEENNQYIWKYGNIATYDWEEGTDTYIYCKTTYDAGAEPVKNYCAWRGYPYLEVKGICCGMTKEEIMNIIDEDTGMVSITPPGGTCYIIYYREEKYSINVNYDENDCADYIALMGKGDIRDDM